MPVIHVQMLGSATREQKAQTVLSFPDARVRLCGRDPQRNYAILDEKRRERSGNAGEMVVNRRAKQQA